LIEREEMQEVAERFEEPIELIIGSHSALDAAAGARDYGIKRIIYTTPGRAEIYLSNPIVGDSKKTIEDLPSEVRGNVIVRKDPRDIPKSGSWRHCILILNRYDDVLKFQSELQELECLQIPNRAFSVYVGGEGCRRIENDFAIPIVGSRKLLKMEDRRIEKNYYWYLERAGIPCPKEFGYLIVDDGIKFERDIEQPLVLKVPFASRRYERGFVFAADSAELERKIKEEVMRTHIDKDDLKLGRVEEVVPGVTANFNFFYSPINAREDWGELTKLVPAWKLANEFLSIDERRETTYDGIARFPARDQMKMDWSKTDYPEALEVTAHALISLRESLLRFVFPIANKFVELTQKEEPPGMIGAYCLQTLFTYQKTPQLRMRNIRIGLGVPVEEGVYDVPEGREFYDFIPVTQDVATRHGGGTNVHMGIGSQYANVKYRRPMSMGSRIALEIKRACKKGMLGEIVT